MSACGRCNHVKADRARRRARLAAAPAARSRRPGPPGGWSAPAGSTPGGGRTSTGCRAGVPTGRTGLEEPARPAGSTVRRMAELHDLTALEQAAAVRAGEVSALELVEHYPTGSPRLDAGARRLLTADRSTRPARRREPAPLPATVRRCTACRSRSRTSTSPRACRRLRLPGDTRLRADGRRPRRRGCATPARSASARPPPRSSACPATPSPTSGRRPATRGTSRGRPAAPAAAPALPSPPGCSRSRRARRRRLDPHPGQRQRPGRHSRSRAGGSAAGPVNGDITGLSGTARWPAPSATRPRCSTSWPGRCRATRTGRPRRPRASWPPASARRGGCGSAATRTPTCRARGAPARRRRLGGGLRPARGARPRGGGHRPAVRPGAAARLRVLWSVSAAGVPVAAGARGRSAPADPLAARAGPGGVGPGLRPGGRDGAGRDPARRAGHGGVRRAAAAHAGAAAGAGRVVHRGRAGRGVRADDALDAVHRRLQRHRPAGGEPAAVDLAGRPADRGDARGAPGRRG